MIVGTIILASSTTLAQLLVGRIVTGIGNGFNSSNIPAYQSELCGAKNRGMLLSLQGVVTIVGLCIAYWLDYGLSFTTGGIQWRFPIAFQGFFAICLVLQMLSLPETPRYLVLKGEMEKASQVVAALHGKGTRIDDPEVLYVIKQIDTGIQIESEGGPFRYKELLQGGRTQNFRRIMLCCAVNVMQQFTGSNMINYYAPVVYANAMHLSRNLSLILGGCTSLTYLLGSLIPLWAMDRFGRRALLMFSATGLTACFAIAAGLLSTGTTSAAYGATAMVFLFQIFLGIGFLPIPWFYPAEVTTTRIRSKGQSLASFISRPPLFSQSRKVLTRNSTDWMCVFTVVQITPIAIGNIGWRTFIIFACFNALWVPIVYAFFPETNQLELEDIDHLFDKGGLTGGVWESKGGRTVEPGGHVRDLVDSAGALHAEQNFHDGKEESALHLA